MSQNPTNPDASWEALVNAHPELDEFEEGQQFVFLVSNSAEAIPVPVDGPETIASVLSIARVMLSGQFQVLVDNTVIENYLSFVVNPGATITVLGIMKAGA